MAGTAIAERAVSLNEGNDYLVSLYISYITGTLHVSDSGGSTFDETFTTTGWKHIVFTAAGTFKLRLSTLAYPGDVTVDQVFVSPYGWEDEENAQGGVMADAEIC